MQIIKENLWKLDKYPVLIVVTTNAELDARMRLVMGAGAALEAKQKAPELPVECADVILQHGKRYGFKVVRSPRREGRAGLGIFQTKVKYADPANFDLMQKSCEDLRHWALDNSDVGIRLNFPGIGLGRLKRDEVEPMLDIYLGDLDNITICYQ